MYAKLPRAIQRLGEEKYKKFVRNPDAPEFHLHPLEDRKKSQHKDGSYSVWINQQYRAIYVVEDGVNLWYWVGSHSAYNIFVGDAG